jgi:GntR family transcriptional repressor for pyruvate dehydrogenase complex
MSTTPFAIAAQRASQSQPANLTSDVKGVLLGWIRNGDYPPGARLPSVPQLVDRLGVSRTVIREALQALVGMHLIVMRPGMGCFVRSVPAELIANADVVAALIDRDTMRHVLGARKILEGAIAAAAAQVATDKDFRDIENAVSNICTTAARGEAVHGLAPLFHVAVARATHNPVLESVIVSFNALMRNTGEILEAASVEHYREQECISHRQLLDVLKRRDPEAARAAFSDHIQETIDELGELLEPPKQPANSL